MLFWYVIWTMQGFGIDRAKLHWFLVSVLDQLFPGWQIDFFVSFFVLYQAVADAMKLQICLIPKRRYIFEIEPFLAT